MQPFQGCFHCCCGFFKIHLELLKASCGLYYRAQSRWRRREHGVIGKLGGSTGPGICLVSFICVTIKMIIKKKSTVQCKRPLLTSVFKAAPSNKTPQQLLLCKSTFIIEKDAYECPPAPEVHLYELLSLAQLQFQFKQRGVFDNRAHLCCKCHTGAICFKHAHLPQVLVL